MLRRRLAYTLLLAALLATQAHAQTIDWIAGGSTDRWDEKDNWAGGNVPDTSGETARFNVGGSFPAELPGDFTINDLIALTGLPQLRPTAGANPTLTVSDDLIATGGGGFYLSAQSGEKLIIDVNDELRIDGGSGFTADSTSGGVVAISIGDLRLADIGSGSGDLNLIGPDASLDQTGFTIINVGQDGPAQFTLSDRARATFSAPLQLTNFADAGSTASVLVESGSRLTLNSLQVSTGGTNAGVSGSVTVTGANSVATTTGVTTIGGSSTPAGSLAVSTGGRFDSGGLLTVNPSGILNVDGGTLNAMAGLDASSGGVVNLVDGTLTVSGGVFAPVDTTPPVPAWAIDGASPTDRPHLVLASGATDGFASGISDGDLDVGDVNHGELSVTEGVDFRTRHLRIGDSASAVGVATVDGAGSQLWGGMAVGVSGDADVTVSNGGHLRATINSTIGINSGSTGIVTVTGAGSSYQSNVATTIGFEGTGTVQIEDGATFTPGGGGGSSLLTLGRFSSGDGTLVVTGDGSTSSHTGGLTVGSSGTGLLEVRDRGLVRLFSTGAHPSATIGDFSGGSGEVLVTNPGSTFLTDGALIVGDEGDGALRVENGGQVTSETATVAADNLSHGTVTVTGFGSRWETNAAMTIGTAGAFSGDLDTVTVETGGTVEAGGPLLIESRGQLRTEGGTVEALDTLTVATNGFLTINGGAVNAHAGLDATGGALSHPDGVLTVTGGAFLPLSDPAGSYYFLSGGDVGDRPETVLGAGSSLAARGVLLGSTSREGALRAEAGADIVLDIELLAGRGTDSVGAAVITGAGSTLDAPTVVAGDLGEGMVTVADGGRIETTDAIVGRQAGSNGTLTLTGAASRVVATTTTVGDAGIGTLHLQGGVLETDTLRVASSGNPGDGTITMDAGQIDVATDLVAGENGSAQATLFFGSTLNVGGDAVLHPQADVSLFGGTLSVDAFDPRGGRVLLGSGKIVVADPTQDLLVAPDGFSIGGQVIDQNNTGPNRLQVDDDIEVAGDLVVLPGARLSQEGGDLTARTLTITTGGEFEKSGGGPLSVGRVATAIGSSLRFVGTSDNSIGDATALNGVVIGGEFFVDAFAVITLLDANDAVFDSGALVSMQSQSTEIFADNGLTIDFGANVVGQGSLVTPDDPTKPLTNNGHIAGVSPTMPITLTGYVKGVGTCDNCVITGTDAPGFSPATVVRGSVAYRGVLEIEIGGTGSGDYDRLEHLLGAGVADLGGELQIVLIDGYELAAGDQIEFLNASGVTGAFDTETLPMLGGGLDAQLVYGADSVALAVVGIEGDYNYDGVVDAADYTVWRDTLGQAGSGLAADGDNNGVIEQADYAVWQANYGATAVALASAVPEPGGLALLAAVGLLSIRKRHCGIK